MREWRYWPARPFAKSDQLEAMGVPLTEMLQDGRTCLTYYR